MRLSAVLPSLAAALTLVAGGALAQPHLAVLRGTVVSDSANTPIRGAVVTLMRLNRSTLSDSSGAFILPGIEAGVEIVQVRRVGYAPITTRLKLPAGDTLDVDFEMSLNAQRLTEVRVKGQPPPPPKLAEFERRRAAGFGHFVDDSVLSKMQNRLTSEVVNLFPGQQTYRSNVSTAAWVASSRGQQSIQGAFRLDPSDVKRGAPNNQCYAAVFLDGTPVFTGRRGELLFDVNSVPPSQIAAMEYYGGSSSLPPEFNVGGNTCGALVIWTK